MTQNKVMKLWTAFVTAFLALCTALGLITTTAAAAVPQAGATRNSEPSLKVPTVSYGTWSYSRALPPTMKQRIRAEAHGSSPSCRHRPPADDAMADLTALCGPQALTEADTELVTEHITPLQR
ncbi:DUF6344 domain-containing protein [Streptomyces sp. R41]|uniref:DUF6344 domain-containing protein n=1 Tax=Streptomyces sp. R41 TaxID=3238632 RepID=A0AB39RL22_9ACTN